MKLALSMTLPSGERQTRVLDPDLLGPGDDRECRKATGLPVNAFIGADTMGLDSLMVVWWMAGRQAGKRETLTRIEATWPDMAAVERAEPDVEVIDPEAEAPA